MFSGFIRHEEPLTIKLKKKFMKEKTNLSLYHYMIVAHMNQIKMKYGEV